MGAFLHHLFRALGGYVQKWTKQNIPSDCKLLHDFGDGEGAVPAAPVDNGAYRNDIVACTKSYVQVSNASFDNTVTSLTKSYVQFDSAGFQNNIVAFTKRFVPYDSAAYRNDIIEFIRSN